MIILANHPAPNRGLAGPSGPGRHFRDFFGISGPKVPRDLCKGRASSQDKTCRATFHQTSCGCKDQMSRPLKTLASLKIRSLDPFSHGDDSIWSLPLCFFPKRNSSIYGGPEGYFRLAIIAFGALKAIVPKYEYRSGKMDKRSLGSLIWGGHAFTGRPEIISFKILKTIFDVTIM